ncbi:hypothetical protein ACIPRU_15645 [Streptomyces sp. NPDC090126]|uniref:hypothetical protein n=1 Tax=Streptomyces sp. NPDC090126 TaxID=3365952 RepID=UPI00380865E4
MGDTFGGPHRRPDPSGIGHTRRELQDRASYDCAPRAGVSCALIAALIAGVLTILAAYTATGGIA